jgi:hypothetical protein
MVVVGVEYRTESVYIRSIWFRSHLYASRVSFICGVRFVKPYVTSAETSEAPLMQQGCEEDTYGHQGST